MLLGSAYGKVELDASGVAKGVKTATTNLESLQLAAEKIGTAMQNAGRTLTLGVTLPLLAAGGAAIKYASDLNETKNKVEVIFGDMSTDILKWSETSARALGQSRTQALDAASNFAIFGKAAGLAGKDVVDFAEANTQMASDLASFFNTSPEEAITAIGAAYRGESEPIRKYGVLINEAALQQKALELGIISQLGPLTQQQRILAANALILEQTKDAQGDFARTSDGLANSTRIMKAELQDALAVMGQNLLPVVIQVVHALNRLLEAFANMTPFQQKMVLGFLGMLAIAGPLLSFFGTLLTTASSISVAWPAITAAFASFGTVTSVSVLPALAAISPILIIILAILLGLGIQLGILYLAWKFNFLGMRDNLTAFVSIVKSLWRALGAFLHGDTKAMLEALQEAFQTFMDRLKEIFSGLFGLREAWNGFIAFLSNAVKGIRDYIVNAFTKTNWDQVGKYILFGIANGMLLGLPALLLVAAGIAKQLLAQIKKSLGIASDSKEGIKIGYFLGHGFTSGVELGMDPNVIARMVTKPVTNTSSSQQQIINMQFPSGLTTQQVQGMIAQNNAALIEKLNFALGS